MDTTLVQFIERVLASPLLTPDLVYLPDLGAEESELVRVFNIPENLPLISLLRRWNGLDLEVIRIHGIGNTSNGLPSVTTTRCGLVIASDPSGFHYIQLPDRTISSFDHDGGSPTHVANNVDDLLRNYVFGCRAASFSGDEWAAEIASSLG